MATYLIRCVEVGREQQARHCKLRRDLAHVIAERWPTAAIEATPGRLIVDVPDALAADLAALPGVLSVAPCTRTTRAELVATLVAFARTRLGPTTPFALRVRRDRRLAPAGERTPDLARRLADAIAHATGAPTDLDHPAVTIGVELRGDTCFVFADEVPGIDRTGPPAPRPPGAPRFVADQMLGRLAARLRLLGYDTLTVHDLADSEVARLAAADGRILLTRDAALARSHAVATHFVHATRPQAQLAEVLAAYALDTSRLFTRCTLCNTPVVPVDEAAIGERLPPGVRDRGLAFFRCPACDQLYWRGSHVDRILADLAASGVR